MGDDNVLEFTVVIVAHLGKYTENHGIVNFK